MSDEDGDHPGFQMSWPGGSTAGWLRIRSKFGERFGGCDETDNDQGREG